MKTDKGRLREKRGTGRGIYYIPWLKVREVPSLGRCHRVFGIKHKRIYQLFSDLEYYYFLLQSFNDNVYEIREQFPLLSLQHTQLIAKELDIRHPSFQGKDIVMSTDFLITVKDGNVYKDIVRTVKPSDKITSRVLEKFLIEEEFFKRQYHDNNFDWGVVTEKQINQVKALNISNVIGSYYWPSMFDIGEYIIDKMKYDFKNLIIRQKSTYDAITEFQPLYRLERSEVIGFIQYLISHKEVKVDLEREIIRDFYNIEIKL